MCCDERRQARVLGAAAVEVGSQRHGDGGRAGLVQVDESREEAVSSRVVGTEGERLLELIDDDDRRATADRSAQRPLRIRAGRDDGSRALSCTEEAGDEPGSGERRLAASRRAHDRQEAAFEESRRRRSRRSPRARRRGPRPRSGMPSVLGRDKAPPEAVRRARDRPAPSCAPPRAIRPATPRERGLGEAVLPAASPTASSTTTCIGAASASRRAAETASSPSYLPARGTASPAATPTRAPRPAASARAASKPSSLDANATM